jgi:hypothetical protein
LLSMRFSGKRYQFLLLEILYMGKLQNFQSVKGFFIRKLAEIGYDGVVGVADFRKVYDELMPVQRVN